MKALPMRVQLWIVAFVYAAVLAASAAMIFARHMVYVRDPGGAAAAGGMYAFGDWMLEVMIACMLLVPTFVLIWVIRGVEELYTRFAWVVLGVGLTAPVCFGLLAIPAFSQRPSVLGEIFMARIFCSPVVGFGLLISWLAAKFARARRICFWAVMVEAGTFGVMLGMLLLPWGRR